MLCRQGTYDRMRWPARGTRTPKTHTDGRPRPSPHPANPVHPVNHVRKSCSSCRSSLQTLTRRPAPVIVKPGAPLLQCTPVAAVGREGRGADTGGEPMASSSTGREMAINPIEIQGYLKGLDYPANKEAIVRRAKEHKAPQ